MDNKIEIIRDLLEREEYKIIEMDDSCGAITVRYQMNIIHICPNAEDDFVSMVLPGVDELNEENAFQVMMRCIAVASQQKVVKAYPASAENVLIAYEFNFNDIDDLFFQIEKGLDSLIAAKVQYNRVAEDDE